MSAPRIVFLGNDPWSVSPLEVLAASEVEVALVVTRGPRPAGRGSVLTPTAVADAARPLRLPLKEVDRIGDDAGLRLLRETEPDALSVVAYGELLTPAVLSVATLGAVNLHFSLLPRWRGATPVRRAILAGDEATGVTTMLIDEGLDTGPILLQRSEVIRPRDTATALGDRLAAAGGPLLVQTLIRLAGGELEPITQKEALATYAPKLSKDEREIDWSEGAAAIVRRVRALAIEPGATTTFRGAPLKVFDAIVADADAGASGAPGVIIATGSDAFVVGAGEGCVSLLDVAAAGRRHMSGADFLRGAHLNPGESLR